ncbi:MAG TPA: hypothetical protein VMZ06_11435 [Candidatus Bathyarchaeia archaeon]|nr:hypothetical protein [Candidatus Bathyarchaeia archaeon]
MADFINPFWCSGPVYAKEHKSCVWRKGVIEKITRYLKEGKYVQLIGPHQSGRTTLAIQLCEHLGGKRELALMPVLISCGGLPSENQEAFAATLAERLQEVADAFLTARHAKNVNTRLQDPVRKDLYDLYKALRDVGSEVVRPRAFVLVIDELETLSDTTVCDVLSFFRGLFENYAAERDVAPYRVVILPTRDMQRWDLKGRSPFNIAEALSLERFSKDEFETFFDDDHVGGMPDKVPSFSGEARAVIFRESGGNPYFVQRICHAMVERAKDLHRRDDLSAKDALYACIVLFEHGDEKMKRLNHDILSDSEEWSLCEKLVSGLQVAYRGVQTEVDRLAELGVVYDKEGFCDIPIGLYRRRLINRCYNERYPGLDFFFDDQERLLLSYSPTQAAVLNASVSRVIEENLASIEAASEPGEREKKILAIVEALAKDGTLEIDLKEVNAFLEYYGKDPLPNIDELLRLIAKWFNIVIDRKKSLLLP